MFKELFESNKRLIFEIIDSSLFGGKYQYLLDDMKLSYPMLEDGSTKWISNPLPPAHIKILKKEIESQLPFEVKKGSKFKEITSW